MEYFNFSIRIDWTGTLGNFVTIYRSLLLALIFPAAVAQRGKFSKSDLIFRYCVGIAIIFHFFGNSNTAVGIHNWKTWPLLPTLYILVRESCKLLSWVLVGIRNIAYNYLSTYLFIAANSNLRSIVGLLLLFFTIKYPPSVLMIPLLVYAIVLTIVRKKSFEMSLLAFTFVFELPNIISYSHTKTYYPINYSLLKFLICMVFVLHHLPRRVEAVNSIIVDFAAVLTFIYGWKFTFMVDELCLALISLLMFKRTFS